MLSMDFTTGLFVFQFDIPLTASFIALYYYLLSSGSRLFTNLLFATFFMVIGVFIKGPVMLALAAISAVLILILPNEYAGCDYRINKNRVFLVWMLASLGALLVGFIYLLLVRHTSKLDIFHLISHDQVQRFSKSSPDPNVPSSHQNLNFSEFLIRPLSYVKHLFMANIIFILLFIVPILKGVKFFKRSVVPLFFMNCLLLCLFFGWFVGEKEARYVLPATPLLILGLTNLMYQSKVIIRMYINVAIITIFLSIFISVFYRTFYVRETGMNLFFTSQAKLRSLVRNNTPVYVIDNDMTRFTTGWPNFLANSTKIKQLTNADFHALSMRQLNVAWCVKGVGKHYENKDAYLLMTPHIKPHHQLILVKCSELK